ncbi:MAG: hypothetical protein HYR55_04385 [Acidobacteria bacterium]|nr:hypothetical protein [Acidobacteriota bacterium]MBI3656317.1 hypothetical protein [Acidobacteriota bacterium]
MLLNLVYGGLLSLAILFRLNGNYYLFDRVMLLFVTVVLLTLTWRARREREPLSDLCAHAHSGLFSKLESYPKSSALILILFLSFMAYFKTLNSHFVADDPWVLRDFGKDMTLPGLLNLFRITPEEGFVRPLEALSITADYFLWGPRPLPFHLMNLFFHMGNALLIFFLLRHLMRNFALALLSALIFTLHPIHSEVVVWVTGRVDAICSLFYLCGLLSYSAAQTGNEKKYFAISLGFFVLALLTKEVGLTFPLAMVVLDLVVLRKFHRANLRKQILIYCPFLIALAMYIFWRTYSMGNFGGYHGTNAFLVDLSTLRAILVTPFEFLIFPINQPLLASYPLALRIVLVAMVAAPLYWLVLRKSSYQSLALFAVLLIIIAVIPVHHIAGRKVAYPIMHSRWYYLSSVGFSILLAIVALNATAVLRRFRIGFIVVLLFSYGFILAGNNAPWGRAGEAFRRASTFIATHLPRSSPERNVNLYLLDMPLHYDGALLFWGAASIVADQYVMHSQQIFGEVHLVDSIDNYVPAPFSFNEKRPLADLDLGNADFVYQWDVHREDLRDVTAQLKKALNCEPILENRQKAAPAVPLELPSIAPYQQIVAAGRQKITLERSDRSPAPMILFTTGAPIPPCMISQIEISLSAVSKSNERNIELEVFWKGDADKEFNPIRRVTQAVQSDGKTRVYHLELNNRAHWYLGGNITHIGVLPKDDALISIDNAKLAVVEAAYSLEPHNSHEHHNGSE